MKFVDDMKIGKKLLGGFLIVVVILAIVAGYGYMNAQSSAVRSAEMYNERLLPIVALGDVQADFQQLRAEAYRYTYIPESRATLDTTIADLNTNIKKNMDVYRANSLTDVEKADLAKFDTNYATFMQEYAALQANAKANNMAAVTAALTAGSPLINARTATVAAYKDIITINENKAKVLADQTAADAATASLFLAILTIAGIVIAIALGLYLSRSITGPIDNVKRNLDELSKGHLGNRMKLSRKDEIGEMAGTMDTFSEDLQKNVVGSMKKIADGDLNVMVMAKDPQDEITPALMNTVTSLQGLVTETRMLTEAGANGKLDVRGNADHFKGGYKEIVVGVNNTLDAIIGPLNVSAEYMDRISKGDIPARITDTYKGDFNEIKNNLNQCIDAINLLVKDSQMLAAGAVDGKLDVRADASKHQGDF